MATATAERATTRNTIQRALVLEAVQSLHNHPTSADVFSLTFLPEEMSEALDVPLENMREARVAWHADLIAPAPSKLACFPFAQHLLSDSPGSASSYASEEELAEAARAVDFDALASFSIGSMRTGFVVSSLVTLGVVAALVVALVLK